MKYKKGEMVKIITKGLLLGGAVVIASSSPYFLNRIIPKLTKYSCYKLKLKKIEKRRFYNAFNYLKNKGMIKMENRGKQLHISLTNEGRKIVGKYQIDDLEIKKPRKWDRKWRVLIFDIKEKNKIKREALRGKIKELGLFQLQKSVWVCPYDFFKEINLLRSFFGLSNKEIIIITASEIENDGDIKIFYNLVKKQSYL